MSKPRVGRRSGRSAFHRGQQTDRSAAQGKTFPRTRGPALVTINSASVAPSGDRLLISLRVKATETKSWFGFGANADVHVWGKPVLDAGAQVLRLTDIELDVQSQEASGCSAAAARTAVPYLKDALAANAQIDLKRSRRMR